MTPEGRLVIVGVASGRAALIPSFALLVGDSGVLGVDFPSYVRREPEVVTAALREILDWLALGHLSVIQPRGVGLDEAVAALAAMARGERQPKTFLLIKSHDH